MNLLTAMEAILTHQDREYIAYNKNGIRYTMKFNAAEGVPMISFGSITPSFITITPTLLSFTWELYTPYEENFQKVLDKVKTHLFRVFHGRQANNSKSVTTFKPLNTLLKDLSSFYSSTALQDILLNGRWESTPKPTKEGTAND